ncbi:CBS domain-containing protein [Ferrovibrio xuzhouensis]|uniref:CBS domain-containing protein n=1 Tax=Ferrovibrio xuzhouensis TaxID=1576914 RepID=A0ABV7VAI2_9PROT
MLARDIMTSDVVTVDLTMTVREIANLLVERRISGVPVVDGERRVLGIVSEADLMRRSDIGTEKHRAWWSALLDDAPSLAREFVQQSGIHAADVMSRDVLTVTEDTSIFAVADLMDTYNIKRVPVLRQSRLAGIISRSDIVRVLAKRQSMGETVKIPQTDSEIRLALVERMRTEAWANAPYISTTVHDGIVELNGFIGSDSEKQALRVLAETLPGVHGVLDRVQVFVPPVSMT